MHYAVVMAALLALGTPALACDDGHDSRGSHVLWLCDRDGGNCSPRRNPNYPLENPDPGMVPALPPLDNRHFLPAPADQESVERIMRESTENWYLPRWAVDSLQQATLEQTVELAKRADTIDLVLRVDGQEVRLQADWVKHLAKTATQSP